MISELEYMLTNSYKDGIVSYMHSHPECFEEAIQLAIGDKQPYSWRAAWMLWSVMEKNDKRIQAHMDKIINCLPKKKRRTS